MIVAYACDLNVYVSVNFGDEILLMREECKTQVNLNFSEKWENRKLPLQYRLQNWNFFRYQITKWTSSLDSSHEIYLPKRISSNSETYGFSRFSEHRVPGGLKKTRFLRKISKLENKLSKFHLK